MQNTIALRLEHYIFYDNPSPFTWEILPQDLETSCPPPLSPPTCPRGWGKTISEITPRKRIYEIENKEMVLVLSCKIFTEHYQVWHFKTVNVGPKIGIWQNTFSVTSYPSLPYLNM